MPTVALDGTVLPRITETVTVADALRSELMRRFARIVRRRLGLPEQATWRTHPEMRSKTFSGKDVDGKIHGSHDHAYFLPTDEDGDGRIDHLTVVAKAGFCPDETSALDSLRGLRLAEAELALQLVGLGQTTDFRSPLFDPTNVWRSATPFVVTRHVKTRGTKKDPPGCRGIDGRAPFARLVLDEELSRWFDRRGCRESVPEVAAVLAEVAARSGKRRGCRESVPEVAALSRDRPGNHPGILEFRRARKGKPGDDGFRRAAGEFSLTFAEPISGPICLGHDSHFGLGLFLADPMGDGSFKG